MSITALVTRADAKAFRTACKSLILWWPGTELNRRRQPFQGCALPAELPGHDARVRKETMLRQLNYNNAAAVAPNASSEQTSPVAARAKTCTPMVLAGSMAGRGAEIVTVRDKHCRPGVVEEPVAMRSR